MKDVEAVYRYTTSKQSGRRMRRVCEGILVHDEQTVRDGDAASVCGYTGTICANSQGQDAASVYGYTGTL